MGSLHIHQSWGCFIPIAQMLVAALVLIWLSQVHLERKEKKRKECVAAIAISSQGKQKSYENLTPSKWVEQ